MKNIYLLWKDATIDGNELHGVVEIDEFDIAHLIAEKYREETGNRVAHVEYAGQLSDPEILYPHLKRLDIGQEME